MKAIFLKNLRVAAPRVLICLVFDLLIDFILGVKNPMFAVFMMNLACIIIAQDSKEMKVEASWPVERRECVDVRYILMLMTMAVFSLKIRLTGGDDALIAISVGLFIVALSAGTAFPFAVAGRNFVSGLISGASSAVIVIMMDCFSSVTVPWYAFILSAVAVFISSRAIAMRIWMKGGIYR